MINLILFFATFAFGFLVPLVHGWALATMWRWFVVPVFVKVPTLTTIQAVGVQLVVSVFFLNTTMSLSRLKDAVKGDDSRPFPDQIAELFKNSLTSMVVSLLAVGIGWIWHTYIM